MTRRLPPRSRRTAPIRKSRFRCDQSRVPEHAGPDLRCLPTDDCRTNGSFSRETLMPHARKLVAISFLAIAVAAFSGAARAGEIPKHGGSLEVGTVYATL